jgi:hypothetical protein
MLQYPVGVNKLEKARMDGRGQFLQDSMDYLFELAEFHSGRLLFKREFIAAKERQALGGLASKA